MKKIYFIAALAATMLASCANEETTFEKAAGQEISFQTLAYNSTRGAITTSDQDQFKAPIYVAAAYDATADCTGETFSNLFASSGNDFVPFLYKGTSWVSDTKYYYPKQGAIDFLAYAVGNAVDESANAASVSLVRNTNQSFKKLTLEMTALDGKKELMYAMLKNVGCPPTTPPRLGFQHALAWLSFAVSCDQNEQIIIHSMTIDDVYLNGTVEIPINDDRTLGTPVWSAWDSKQPAMPVPGFYFDDEADYKYAEQCSDASGILVAPGYKPKSITLKYAMASNPGQEITKEIKLNGEAALEPGKHYTYTLSINLQYITFTCTVGNYESKDVPGTL